MNRTLPAILAASSLCLVALVGCGSASSSSSTAAAPASHLAHHKGKPKSCKRKTTFDYLERTVEPGLRAQADEIGNTDYSSCRSSLATFTAEAGQADGECTAIALKSSNPGYDADAIPAKPLKDVIMSAGPGC